MSFNELGLSPHILRAVKELGYEQPTPIQQQAIPAILAGQDVLGGAQTGTGKTAGFTLPMLHRLMANHGRGGRRQVRALVLTPTRELAAQVGESIIKYAHHLPFRTLIAYGGVSIKPNLDAIKLGVDILVATPGRLLDLLTQRALTLTELEVLVLDEADRMLDMGFITDIRRIMKALPEERQTLLFSATFSDEIKALADDLLKNPALIEVSPSNSTAEQVNQRIIKVDRERKRELLSHMIGRHNWQRVLVFVRTKQIADRLAHQMVKDGLDTVAIHGDKTQGARNRALADFREGKVRVLVATDIAARGLDIDHLPHVINFELPQVAEDYIHRIGRTGRAGRGGEAISLVSLDEQDQLKAIEALIGLSIPSEIMEGYEPSGKPTRQTLPGSKPVQNPPRDRGHANAKHNAKSAGAKGKGKPAARGDAARKPAPARKREVVGEDIGFTPMRRLPKTQRDSYQDDSAEE
ncbi:DEAD/DEAH box helicase [Aeromonas encheleia]|uniref:DEAD-box ATP-dependent RNA helicase RhpA n=1 Tax=Aeromonas encheleia TaxID=73010 RepID=A0AAE9MJC1_9GAMM|nr:DEAD/DEAH box helicase [Aeromonas encheleia]USV59264.1 DEAD/DEAH box helicase [Aeromonas encheleia]